jgi:hypothetical protein
MLKVQWMKEQTHIEIDKQTEKETKEEGILNKQRNIQKPYLMPVEVRLVSEIRGTCCRCSGSNNIQTDKLTNRQIEKQREITTGQK